MPIAADQAARNGELGLSIVTGFGDKTMNKVCDDLGVTFDHSGTISDHQLTVGGLTDDRLVGQTGEAKDDDEDY